MLSFVHSDKNGSCLTLSKQPLLHKIKARRKRTALCLLTIRTSIFMIWRYI